MLCLLCVLMLPHFNPSHDESVVVSAAFARMGVACRPPRHALPAPPSPGFVYRDAQVTNEPVATVSAGPSGSASALTAVASAFAPAPLRQDLWRAAWGRRETSTPYEMRALCTPT